MRESRSRKGIPLAPWGSREQCSHSLSGETEAQNVKESNVRSGRKEADAELVEQQRRTIGGFFPGSIPVSPGFAHASRAPHGNSAYSSPALGLSCGG